MLILFDIDGTLLLTQGAGIAAMADAGRELFGEHFTVDGVEFSGRLDHVIFSDLVRRNRVNGGTAHHDRFRSAYHRHLGDRLTRNPTARLLPGVQELVDRLGQEPTVTLGLLTGNYPETGALKIRAAGMDPRGFTVNAWGCEGGSRRDLPALAMHRYARRNGGAISPDRVVIIGDTPHDIDCAKAHGCRSLGVATGAFSKEDLHRVGADLAVDDLSKTHDIVSWIMRDLT
ncbi:MAG: HAD hydrolase-like protein [Phycisphaerales bacterium]|nr:HAD hydrolase-like protein [Phycisphaerales bacterium]MCI0677082.1 HAD hydrolase-like protein [Phycisphaerales bacterium]